jgi:hypothetical protein
MEVEMTEAIVGDKLRYVLSFTDRHGHRRHYYRRRGQKLVPLPGELGSPEFNRAYEVASGGKVKAATKRSSTGKLRRAGRRLLRIVRVPGPAANHAGQLPDLRRALRERFGDMPAQMSSKDVRALIQEPPTPAAGNNVLGAIRRLVAFGMAQTPPMLTSDPTLGVKRRKCQRQEALLPGRMSDIAEP